MDTFHSFEIFAFKNIWQCNKYDMKDIKSEKVSKKAKTLKKIIEKFFGFLNHFFDTY